MGTKVGALIKDARTKAKLSQNKLAELAGIGASDIAKAEKGEKELSQAVLKKIATATGVTQKSLVDAAKEEADSGLKKVAGVLSDALGGKKTSAKKTTAEKKTTAKKATAEKKTTAKKATEAKKTTTAAKKTATTAKKTTTAAKKTTSAAKKTTTAAKKTTTTAKKTTSGTKVELTAAEKKLVELYRAADADTKKSAVSVLKGEGSGLVGEILSGLLKK